MLFLLLLILMKDPGWIPLISNVSYMTVDVNDIVDTAKKPKLLESFCKVPTLGRRDYKQSLLRHNLAIIKTRGFRLRM